MPNYPTINEAVDTTFTLDGTLGNDANATWNSTTRVYTITGPVRTFAKACDIITRLTYDGTHANSPNTPVPHPNQRVKCIVKPGIYRTTGSTTPSLSYWFSPVLTNTTIIEGDTTGGDGSGTCIISGAETTVGTTAWGATAGAAWNADWVDEGNGVWSHAWPYAWGLGAVSPNFAPPDNDIAIRREMLFVNNKMLEPKLTLGEVTFGCFHVDEITAHKIYCKLPGGVSPNGMSIEVPNCTKLVDTRCHSNFILRNLIFEKANNFLGNQINAVDIGGLGGPIRFTADILVDHCTFRWMGAIACEITMFRRAWLRQCKFHDNGANGLQASNAEHLVVDDCDIYNNGWRLVWGGYDMDFTAGTKFSDVYHASFLNCRVYRNQTKGIWFDVYCNDCDVTNSTVSYNDGDGVFIEICQPGMRVINSTLEGNGYVGVHSSLSEEVSILGSTIRNNSGGQIGFGVSNRSNVTTVNRETGLSYTCSNARNCIIRDNTIVSYASDQPLFTLTVLTGAESHRDVFWATLDCDKNTYQHPNGAHTYSLGLDDLTNQYGRGSMRLSDWRLTRGRNGQRCDQASTISTVQLPAIPGGQVAVELYPTVGSHGPATANNLLADLRYIARSPTIYYPIDRLEFIQDSGTISVQVARGTITPPVSGAYRFWVTGQKYVDFLLSTDSSAANLQSICRTTSLTIKEWRLDVDSSQASAEITLVGGTPYAFELRQVNNRTGGTNPENTASVAWQLPASDTSVGLSRRIIPAQHITQTALSTTTPTTGVLREWWSATGDDLWQLTNRESNPNVNLAYPHAPFGTSYIANLDAPRLVGQNMGHRLRGYITAPTSGTYYFWMTSQKAGEFRLSTDHRQANVVTRCTVDKALIPAIAEWNKAPAQKSIAITLTAGQRYYFDVIHKNADSTADHCTIGWSKPGEPTTVPSEVVPMSVLTPAVRPIITSWVLPDTAPGPTVNASVTVTGGEELTYLWEVQLVPGQLAAPSFAPNNTAATTITFPGAGTYLITCTVTSASGLIATLQRPVVITRRRFQIAGRLTSRLWSA